MGWYMGDSLRDCFKPEIWIVAPESNPRIADKDHLFVAKWLEDVSVECSHCGHLGARDHEVEMVDCHCG